MAESQTRTTGRDRSRTARDTAEQLCAGFVAHDERDREAAIAAFLEVDTRQFAHVDRAAAREAAVAYVDALRAKDDIERPATSNGELDRTALAGADWGPVKSAFRRRADAVGVDPRYALESTIAWRNHEIGQDYWTPMRRAQTYELRAALQDPDYPEKPRYGRSGHGPEPARYALAVELHDVRTEEHVEQAVETMTPYFERILEAHEP